MARAIRYLPWFPTILALIPGFFKSNALPDHTGRGGLRPTRRKADRKGSALRRPAWCIFFQFKFYLKRPNISFLDDEPYRKTALELCFSSSLQASRPLSMVDCLIRLILEDVNVKINHLATFNYIDFIDLCLKRKKEGNQARKKPRTFMVRGLIGNYRNFKKL